MLYDNIYDATNLIHLAKKVNVKVIVKPNNHIQLIGKLTVNWYPFSKHKTAYINGTSKSCRGVSKKYAIQMCNELPSYNKVKRKNNGYTKEKKKLLKKHPFCNWCHCKLTKINATLDHIIPLGRGGLNNFNNYVLACEPCNTERGCDMPEINN